MKKSTIKGRFQWYLRTCNEASALFSVVISFIESLRKFQGYPIALLNKLLLETIYEYEKQPRPFVKNFWIELNITIPTCTKKPDHKRWKAVTFNSCSFKVVKPRVTQNVIIVITMVQLILATQFQSSSIHLLLRRILWSLVKEVMTWRVHLLRCQANLLLLALYINWRFIDK